MKAQTFNNAVSKANTGRNKTTRLRIPKDGNVYCSAIYSVDKDERELFQYEPVWLAYSAEQYESNTVGIDSSLRAYRIDSPLMFFGQLAISREKVKPGEVGHFCVYGKHPARIVSEKITDHPLHFKDRWSIKLKSIFYDLEEDAGDPCFAFPQEGSFTPYYSTNTASIRAVGAKVLWRPISTERRTAESPTGETPVGVGLVVLPVYFGV